ncbi:MAG TPA: glycosyltransferase, partial [Bryobacteraceae bacterium]|nr:glycosyltransferase [Bryobacteraceae bacterium]
MSKESLLISPAVREVEFRGLDNLSVIYFGNDWRAENRTSSHHIARQLSRYFQVLYVDTPGMRAPAATARDVRKLLRIVRKFLALPTQVGPQLWQVTVPQIPYRRLPLVNRLNEALGCRLVKRAARRLGFKDRLSWFAVPHPASMARRVGDEFVVYYCIDDYASLAQMDAGRIRALDSALSQRADIVFVSSRSLLEKKRRLNQRVEYSPHGVDFELFSQAQEPATRIAEGAQRLQHPIIGYFGSIAHHTDLDLIAHLARQRPHWTFLLIGMASVDTSVLACLPNVHFPGGQPYETLPSWTKAFDVAIIPYRDWFAQHSSSLKVREYLAAGKPVVTVSTPEIENYRNLVSIASGPE